MRKLIVILCFLYFCPVSRSQDDFTLVVFWNVENFFDYVDSGAGESDLEWSSKGKRRWTKKRFHTKCDDIAKSLFWIGEKYGKMPDVIGLAEVENRKALWKLLNETLLRKCGYEIVHYDSSDRRGIDVALLYRKASFKKISSCVKTPEFQTRDILHVCLEYHTGQKINMIVNHHPSKYGGSSVSQARRAAVMMSLSEMCDSLSITDKGVPIIAMGDFNDTPGTEQFRQLDGILFNMAEDIAEQGDGTIRYKGKWELIDMFLVSGDIVGRSVMDILKIPFLMVYDKKYPGLKPLRTYSGPRYIGGVSDHCPIVLCIFGTI